MAWGVKGQWGDVKDRVGLCGCACTSSSRAWAAADEEEGWGWGGGDGGGSEASEAILLLLWLLLLRGADGTEVPAGVDAAAPDATRSRPTSRTTTRSSGARPRMG